MQPIGRRTLLAALSVGLAGCSALDDDSGTTATRDGADTTVETTDNPPDGRNGERTTSDEPSSGDDDEDESLSGPLRFGAGVPEAHRERCRRALEQTEELVGEELAAPVTIRYDDPGFLPASEQAPDSSLQAVLGDMVHRVPIPDDFPGGWGQYRSDPREITFVDPDENGALVSVFQREAPADLPDDAFAPYPGESLVGHELVHALQGDTIENLELGFHYEGPHYDGTHAGNTIHEGTAEYVAGRYRARCSNDADTECDIMEFSGTAEQTPAWAVPLNMWYVNGQVLVHHIHEWGGWDAIWAAHRNPPDASWVAMFPEQAVPEGIDTSDVRVPDSSTGQWQPLDADRVGVNPLYEKLLNLGQTSQTDPDGALDPAVTEAIATDQLFRSELLRGWRGDAIVAYEHAGHERTAAHWRVAMASAADARALAGALRQGYEDHGTAVGDGWQLDGNVFTVSGTDSTIDLWMARNGEDLAELRG